MELYYLDYIVPVSVMLPVFIFLYKHGRFPAALKVLFLYLLVSSLINVSGIVLAHKNLPNLWLLHIYTIIEAVFLLLFFMLINTSPVIKKILRVLLLLFPLACIANMLLFQSSDKFNTYARSVEALLFIFFSIRYWLSNSEESEYETWFQNPYNWVTSGILLYFSSSFFLFLFSNIMLADAHQKLSVALTNAISFVWVVHGTLVIIQYILISVGFSTLKNGR